MQLRAHVVDSLILKWCCVTLITIQARNLTQNALDQMTNGHTRRDSVGIDNHVWVNTFASEWQILLPISHTTSTLLTVTRGEFITDLRNFNSSHFDFNESLVFVICSQNDLVYVAFLRVL